MKQIYTIIKYNQDSQFTTFLCKILTIKVVEIISTKKKNYTCKSCKTFGKKTV